MADELLHIYGQCAFHDNVEIVGNREALEALRDTISEALYGIPHFMEPIVNDGEGYRVYVRLAEGDWDSMVWQKLAVPYMEDYASEKREGAIAPWQL